MLLDPRDIREMDQFVDLNSILSEVAARISEVAEDKLRLETRLDPNLSWIQADPKQIDWLFVNLAADAYDGMPDGGTLAIRTSNVELNFPGSREAELPPGRYVQAEFAISQGTIEIGTTVRKMVQQLRGRVAMRVTHDSVVIDVLLPAHTAATIPGELLEPRNVASPVLLVVSSDALSRLLTRQTLEGAGCHVVEALHGKEAEAVLSAREIHLMITDIVMPEKDGLEIILSVRAVYPNLRIIAVAEKEMGYQLRAARLLGADSVISKPLTSEILCNAVRDQIGGCWVQ